MIKDSNQNFWQLACIQTTSMGLVVMAVGGQITALYGAGKAITSLCIGNLILWIVAFAMFSMTYKSRGNAKHAIENVLSFFGKPFAFIAAIMLMLAFISWFLVQINAQSDFTSKALEHFSGWNQNIQLSSKIIFSLLIIGISTMGIRMIKWVCTCAFPFLALFVIYALIKFPKEIPPIEWGISFHGIVLVVIIIFPGMINLPTFFRHARSREDGVLALALMTVFVIGFQMATIWMQINPASPLSMAQYSPEIGWTSNLLMALGFVALSTFCINLVNIYYASAALELVVPNLADAKGYALIGLIGVLALGIFKSEVIVNRLESITNNSIGSLGVILLVGYLSRIVVNHRFRHFEWRINITCWILGFVVSLTIFLINYRVVESFLAAILTPLLLFLGILFVEETIWSIRTYSNRSDTHTPS